MMFLDTTETGVSSTNPSALPYDARQDELTEIHDQFSPDADEGPCPSCGAPPVGFRTFALWFVAIAMLATGIGFGFIGGCEWHSHMTQTIAQN